MINSYDSYDNKLPKLNGILWQMLLNNVPLRRPWELLGATKTLIQWIAVDDYAFIDNPWLPSYNLKLDMEEFASHDFASEIIVGTPGYFSEVVSRNSIPKMADLAAKFATLDWPENVKGFYLPVEIDPTWTDAKAALSPYWNQLPRPLYISAYYGNGVDGAEAAQWLKDLLPNDDQVILLFQDGVGAFGFTQELALERLGQLEDALGKHRVEMIAEVFKVNPDWDGTPGEFFIPLDEAEYRTRIAAYSKLYQEKRLWAFDGPNYIKNELIDQLNKRPTLQAPTDLAATKDNLEDIRLWSTVPQASIGLSTKYTVYDTSGNTILREYISTPGQGFARYPKADYLEDFGFPPGVVVMDAQTYRNDVYFSDRTALNISTVTPDASVVTAEVIRSDWGDIVFKLWAHEAYPSAYEYKVEIKDPNNPALVYRTLTFRPEISENNIVRIPWGNELNCPAYDEAFPFDGHWNYLNYTLKARNAADNGPEFFIGDYSQIVKVDNTDFVKKTFICGINSLVGGWFNDLSDPDNPGATGRDARRDKVAANSFRNAVAANLGLQKHEVMPIVTYVGSAPIMTMDWLPDFDPENYWWNHEDDTPGPDLILADGIVKALGVIPDGFIQSAPGEIFGLAAVPTHDSPTFRSNWKDSNRKMLAWMRANWGNPNLNIWFQGATTTFFGYAPDPQEIGGRPGYIIRELQRDLCREANTGFRFGSYVPGSNVYTGFMDESPNWLHYSVPVYHAAAAEMGKSIALNTSQQDNPPGWAKLAPVDGMTAEKVAGDVVIGWTPRDGVSQWRIRNYSVATNALISDKLVSIPEWTFTQIEQVAEYGFPVGNIVIRVCEHDAGTNLDGPKEQHVFTGL